MFTGIDREVSREARPMPESSRICGEFIALQIDSKDKIRIKRI